VDYFPFMVESKEKAWVKEERWPEAILVAVPPPIFATLAYVLWFHFSLPPPCKNALGVFNNHF
jgi:hypothetical protein